MTSQPPPAGGGSAGPGGWRAGPGGWPAYRRPVIAGLGMTELGKVYGRSPARLAAEAVRRAAADAGLALADLDGLLTSAGISGGVGLGLQRDLGLVDLRLLMEVNSFGASAGAMVSLASLAVGTGMAEAVVCVFADAPLREGSSAGSAYTQVSPGGEAAPGRAPAPRGWLGLLAASGFTGVNPLYALAARRHMERYGTTSDHLGAIAVAQREWAVLNPLAQMRAPLTLEQYHASRWIAEPLHLYDCCLVSNGGIAVIVTTAARAASLRQPPVHVLGWGQAHPGRSMRRDDDFGLVTGAAQAGPAALAMAGVSIADVDIAELYDCYTFTVLVTLEDYGFCGKGEGGPFVASGALGHSGKVRVNTGGGQLSAYYMWGMTPLSEAIIQARGQAGERQSPRRDVIVVSGNGGILDHHATLVLSPHPPS
jgi:acetyl-CoA acetyltransferase